MGLSLLFTQYLTSNWQQSTHLCRTVLLDTQQATATQLDQLLKLNPVAMTLRASLKYNQIQYASAVATGNPTLAAVFLFRIASIQRKRKALDRLQRSIITNANYRMSSGLLKVQRLLRKQDQLNQTRIPASFRFDVVVHTPRFKRLAVRPDIADIAPVYELPKNFENEQSLSVSWISSFAVIPKTEKTWFRNQNKKSDFCSVSLKKDSGSFQPILVGDKPWSRH